MVIYYTLARLVQEFDLESSMEEAAIRQDGCLEIFPPRSSEGLELRFRPIDVSCSQSLCLCFNATGTVCSVKEVA